MMANCAVYLITKGVVATHLWNRLLLNHDQMLCKRTKSTDLFRLVMEFLNEYWQVCCWNKNGMFCKCMCHHSEFWQVCCWNMNNVFGRCSN